MGWGGMWFGGIFWLLILGLIVWAVITLVNNNNRRNSQNYLPPSEEDALEILKKRYARGEITREQFDQMKRDLQ